MEFVIDRTEADAILGNEKGVYSFTDLNRVEGNVQILSGELKDLGYDVHLNVKTDWRMPGDFSDAQWPVESQMARYLSNIRVIREIYPLPEKESLPKTMDKLTWKTANLIEKILQYAVVQIDGVKKTWKYSGEVFAGEE